MNRKSKDVISHVEFIRTNYYNRALEEIMECKDCFVLWYPLDLPLEEIIDKGEYTNQLREYFGKIKEFFEDLNKTYMEITKEYGIKPKKNPIDQMKDVYLMLVGLTGNGTKDIEEEYQNARMDPMFSLFFSDKEKERDIGIIKKFRNENK